MTKEEYLQVIKFCSFGHHKIRTNKYGVQWCVRCGLLIKSTLNFSPLTEEDKLIIKL